jgi:hypothetical protein
MAARSAVRVHLYSGGVTCKEPIGCLHAHPTDRLFPRGLVRPCPGFDRLRWKAGTSGMTMIRYLRLKIIFTEEMRREAPAK